MGPHPRAPWRAAGIERDQQHARPCAGLPARASARACPAVRATRAFQDDRPAAIKLGQTLATRPDLVGESRRQPADAPGRLPPCRSRESAREIERSFGARSTPFRIIDEAGRRRVDRAGPPRASPPRPPGRGQGAAPGIRAKFASDIDTYEWAAAHLERSAASRAAAPAAGHRTSSAGPRASSTCGARRPPLRARRGDDGRAGYLVPAIDWDRTNGR
jgi:ubiquinone biosynthesis protein